MIHMVTNVYGKADGVDILFTPSPDGKWKCELPANSTGTYLMEIFAEDEAGNTAYYATALFVVDSSKLSVQIQWLDISQKAKMDGFPMLSVQQEPLIEAQAEMDSFSEKMTLTQYFMAATEFSVCGRE